MSLPCCPNGIPLISSQIMLPFPVPSPYSHSQMSRLERGTGGFGLSSKNLLRPCHAFCELWCVCKTPLPKRSLDGIQTFEGRKVNGLFREYEFSQKSFQESRFREIIHQSRDTCLPSSRSSVYVYFRHRVVAGGGGGRNRVRRSIEESLQEGLQPG